MEDIASFQDEFVKRMVSEINSKREEVIMIKLKDLDIEFDFDEEKNRVFKRLAIVHSGNEEMILFNDGSVEGLRVVTFMTKQEPINMKDFSINCVTTYY